MTSPTIQIVHKEKVPETNFNLENWKQQKIRSNGHLGAREKKKPRTSINSCQSPLKLVSQCKTIITCSFISALQQQSLSGIRINGFFFFPKETVQEHVIC